MTKGSFMLVLAVFRFGIASFSTASDRDHDLQPVAVRECGLRETAARHDLAVALHRHALARELQAFEQCGDVGVGLETLGGAVDVDFNHCRDLCERVMQRQSGCKTCPNFTTVTVAGHPRITRTERRPGLDQAAGERLLRSASINSAAKAKI